MSKTDFDLTTIDAVVFDVDGVLSPTCVPMDSDGVPRRMANLRDGYAIQLAVRQGLRIAIITGGNDTSVERRFASLGVTDYFSTAENKIDVLNHWAQTNGINLNSVAYVGDDIPDAAAMQAVGLPVAPADAAPEIKQIARYVTIANGGYGVARELLEQILKAKHQWPLTAAANGL